MIIVILCTAVGEFLFHFGLELRACWRLFLPMEIPRWAVGAAVLVALHLAGRKRRSPGLRLLWDVTSVVILLYGFLQAVRLWRLFGTASDHWAIQVAIVLLAVIGFPLLLASLIGLFWQGFKSLRPPPEQPPEKGPKNGAEKSNN